MNNGCICCTVRGDLIEILKKLLSRKVHFDGIIIETTGMADPAPVAQTFFVEESLQDKVRLDAIITVVDAKHIVQHLDEVKPEGVENESVEQVAFADRILLNKIDLVTPDKLEIARSRIKAINSVADIIETQNSVVDVDRILHIGAFDLNRVRDLDPRFLDADPSEHQHDNSVSSVGFRFVGDIIRPALEGFISDLLENKGKDLYRFKGVLSIKGMDRRFVFQGVHMLFGGHFTDPWEENEVRENKFVFIGKDLDRDMITKGFMACEATGELRFAVGDRVKCIIKSGWKPGKVLRLWDDGNAYKVKLDNGMQVWAPLDDDIFIRRAA